MPVSRVAAGAAVSLAALAVSVLAGPAMAAQPTRPAVHAAATGVRFLYRDGAQITVNKACRLNANGALPKHDGEVPNFVVDNCSLWLDIFETGFLCRAVPPGGGLRLGPEGGHPWLWGMATSSLCPGVAGRG